jgi:ribonuclease P protein component
MHRRSRLTGSKRFSQIHRDGGNTVNRLLVVRFLANGTDQSRFGFMVSKRIGNAVVRNRVKRRLREAVRTCQVKTGWDVVFIARKGSEKADYQALKLAAGNLLRRNQLVEAAGDATQEGRTSETPG